MNTRPNPIARSGEPTPGPHPLVAAYKRDPARFECYAFGYVTQLVRQLVNAQARCDAHPDDAALAAGRDDTVDEAVTVLAVLDGIAGSGRP